MHTSVAAVIRKDGKILMLDRTNFPFGWACPCGHMEEGENSEEAMKREVKEETNLDVKNFNLIHHEFIDWNECKRGVRGHDFFVYEITEWEGEIKSNNEAKDLRWIGKEDIKDMQFEAAWGYLIKKLKLFS